MESKVVATIAAALVISLTLLILSGALYRNYYGLLVLIPFFILPIPRNLCSAMGNESWNAFGYFLEAVVWTCVFGIPSVMLHTDVINTEQFFFVLFADLTILVTYFGLSMTADD